MHSPLPALSLLELEAPQPNARESLAWTVKAKLSEGTRLLRPPANKQSQEQVLTLKQSKVFA